MKRCALTILACLQLAGIESAAVAYDISADSIHRHIAVLASDSLEGREVGEPGEMKAARYISGIFESLGLQPKGDDDSFMQAFDFIKKVDFGPNNRLTVNGRELTLPEEFQPMQQSAITSFEFDEIVDVNYGIITKDSSHNDYAGKDVEGKGVLVKRFSPAADSADTTFDHYSSLTNKIITAQNNKAAGIIFYTPEDHDDTLMSMGVTRVAPKDVPVIFLRRKGLEKLGLDLSAPVLNNASGETDLVRVRDTGYNVVAQLAGQTDTTIIIGAHYDHLGWGGPASRYLEKEKQIHYGADDNGSGTAGLLELARYFQARQDELRHSVLFIAFSGEEAGILGSSHYVRNWTIDSSKARMMINMDMIGRLKDQEKGLAVLGTGTCPEFKEYFDSLDVGDFKMAFKESGSGPSDHTAFYNDSIPVLMFFTGAHEDYHKPTDVVELVDFDGIQSVANMVAGIVEHFDRYEGQLHFQRTKDERAGRPQAAYSVTLGIMPDFISEVQGLRVDGVSPNRPADRAGILKGDIIIRMGNLTVKDIYDYMNALGKFRKGDSTAVVVVRDADTVSVAVEFK